jgi:hypothetical protein
MSLLTVAYMATCPKAHFPPLQKLGISIRTVDKSACGKEACQTYRCCIALKEAV